MSIVSDLQHIVFALAAARDCGLMRFFMNIEQVCAT